MATIIDVAKRSGFSISTVSIVLNNAPLGQYIPDRTKRRIRRVARELSYRPNPFARSLRSRRSHTVGVIVFDIVDPYCTQTLRGIEDSLYRSTFLPVVFDIQNDTARFKRYVQVLIDRQIEGLIALANSVSLQTELFSIFKDQTIPMVVIGRKIENRSISTVVVNNEAGANLALRHLYELGHRQIAFIRGPKAIVDSEERWNGVRTFAQKVGLNLDPKLIMELRSPVSSLEAGKVAAEQLIQRKRPFTAVMAFDDMTALGAIRALRYAGLEVPRGCSVVGFDDISAAAFSNPPLTTVRQPMEAVGTMAGKVLLDAIASHLEKKRFPPVHWKVPPELVVRESTGESLRPSAGSPA